MDYVTCPDTTCGLPAEVIDEYDLDSTDGPVHHLKTRCVNRHVLTQYYT